MTDEHYRRFWQIHVSTAVAMLFVTVILLALNALPNTVQHSSSWARDKDGNYGRTYHYGWPKTAFSRYEPPPGLSRDSIDDSSWNLSAVGTNLLLALAILTVGTITFEWLVRRPRVPSMRFSLTTLLFVAFWIAAAMLVWVWREPWEFDNRDYEDFNGHVANKIPTPYLPMQAPDGRRWALHDDVGNPGIYVSNDPGNRVEILRFRQNWKDFDTYVLGFVNDDVLLFRSNPLHHSEIQCYFHYARRRFPEWWWGHFYRPEVWLALALTCALFWRALRAYRARTQTAVTAPALPAQRAELP